MTLQRYKKAINARYYCKFVMDKVRVIVSHESGVLSVWGRNWNNKGIGLDI